MQRKLLVGSGLLLAFVLLGGAWVSLLRLLPDGLPRSLAVGGLGVAVVGLYVSLLVQHIRGLLRGGERFWLQALMVLAELALLLAGFASMYAHLGIMNNTLPDSPVVHDFGLGIYLSIVTFTTVGYGDMYPVGLGRALAALQGLSGYLVLGILASTAASLVSPYSPAGPGTEERAREEGREEGREEAKEE